jgi:hypothetical protein
MRLTNYRNVEERGDTLILGKFQIFFLDGLRKYTKNLTVVAAPAPDKHNSETSTADPN